MNLAINCSYCGVLILAKNGVQKYCSRACQQRGKLDRMLGARHEAFCLVCGVSLGMVHGTWRKRCSNHTRAETYRVDYAALAERQEHARRKREYRYLLDNADILRMAEFIKLQALSEYFGRDIEEWINASENLQNLNAILHSERQLHDMGEAQKTSPDYLDAVRRHNAAKRKAREYMREWYAKNKKKKKRGVKHERT